MKRTIIIPARYHSQRFPGKPLALINDKPMIAHVYEKALACQMDDVIIATDDKRISEVATSIGATVCMSAMDHPTGTDRLAEVVNKLSFNDEDIIINLQGDEPLISIDNVRQVADNLNNEPNVSIATLCERLVNLDDVYNPNYVKVVFDDQQHALYFSRAPIPYSRECFPRALDNTVNYFRHIGLYAYRAAFVKGYSKLARCPLEQTEKLEQLRALTHGYTIHVDLAKTPVAPGVDTPEELAKIVQLLAPK